MSDEIERLAYSEVMPRVGKLAEELLAHPDESVGEQVEQLLDLVDVFNRDGLTNLLGMIEAWRGEIFLESLVADEVIGELLSAYDLAGLAARNADDPDTGEVTDE